MRTAQELEAVISRASYEKMVTRGKIQVARRGCRGRHALVVFDSLPERLKSEMREIYPQGGVMQLQKWFRDNYTLDTEARTFYSVTFRFDNGDPLPAEKVVEYTNNASVIRAVQRLMTNTRAIRRAQQGGRVNWDEMAEAVGTRSTVRFAGC
ncbi:hypothetical protein [Alistipes sp.]|uniref:hypothetical protein n=1 Tax=Alistipes sp. TaxID=1872444 RepID=UPI003AF16C68